MTALDGSAGDDFGTNVSVSGDFLVTGAYGDDDNGSASGSVYFMRRDDNICPQDELDANGPFTDTDIISNGVATSNVVTITEAPVPTMVTVSGEGSPMLRINGGTWATNGIVENGDTVQLQATASGTVFEIREIDIAVGLVVDQWDLMANGDCVLPWGGTLTDGSSVNAYADSSRSCSQSCSGSNRITRTCTAGVLSGSTSYRYSSCSRRGRWNYSSQSCSSGVRSNQGAPSGSCSCGSTTNRWRWGCQFTDTDGDGLGDTATHTARVTYRCE